MKLYYSPGACSLSPHIALREAGLAFEPVLASTKTHKLPDGTDYYAHQPARLRAAARTRRRHAAARRPGHRAVHRRPGAGEEPRARPTARCRATACRSGSPSSAPRSTRASRRCSIRPCPRKPRQIYRDRLAARYHWLDGELAGKDYLMGEHFTVADGYLFTVTRWAKPIGVDLLRTPMSLACHERVRRRPAVQDALKVEADAKAEAEKKAAAPGGLRECMTRLSSSHDNQRRSVCIAP